MVYSVLTDCNISVRELLAQYDFEENYKEALTSSGKRQEHLEQIIQTAIRHIESVKHENYCDGSNCPVLIYVFFYIPQAYSQSLF